MSARLNPSRSYAHLEQFSLALFTSLDLDAIRFRELVHWLELRLYPLQFREHFYAWSAVTYVLIQARAYEKGREHKE